MRINLPVYLKAEASAAYDELIPSKKIIKAIIKSLKE